MKIALCLSGQPRGLPKSLQLLKDGILNHNPEVDVFIHSWFDDSCQSIPFDSSQPGQSGRVGSWHPQTKELLHELSPKKIKIEPPQPFYNFSHLMSLESAVQTKLASMFYSSFECNQLKCEFEWENNFIYDVVIKTRIDISYHAPVIISNIIDDNLKTNLYVPEMHQHMRMSDSYPTKSGTTYSSMSDTWIMGSSENIDKACSVYPNFENIYNEISPMLYGETYLGYVVRELNKIPISMVNVKYNLFRG